ncbi:hypothetical protein AAF712_002434 [Marasmius tenuissimus]|uniref:Cytokinin riboside 5'-monophosphate phosphoribohydrolase n=1 Tax=Marasmius tenuissimus TaxID=585030 RepID=A0ABR3AB76_9AGAR
MTQNSEQAVAVYCGSSTGNRIAYVGAAESLGKALAKAQRPLVYGGGTQGLMGAVSRSVLAEGGKVTGITLRPFMENGGEGDKAPEKAIHPERKYEISKSEPETVKRFTSSGFSITDLLISFQIVVDSLHARKLLMSTRSCGFVTLPGGFGTYDEVFEATTWTQIGIQTKPIVVINVLGFYDSLKQQIKAAIEAGFVEPHNESLVVFVDGPEDMDQHETFDWGLAALAIGTALAKSDRRLVYGGGNKGLMGAVSRAVVAGGGRVTGIIPVAMVAAGGEQEKVEQPALDEKSALVELEPDDEKFQTILVPSMHTRKVEMARRSCGFIGLPGGYGTFEEVCEAITWTQLGIHDKPVVLINVLGFYEPFRQLIEKSVESGFIQEYNESLVVFVDCPREAKRNTKPSIGVQQPWMRWTTGIQLDAEYQKVCSIGRRRRMEGRMML